MRFVRLSFHWLSSGSSFFLKKWNKICQNSKMHLFEKYDTNQTQLLLVIGQSCCYFFSKSVAEMYFIVIIDYFKCVYVCERERKRKWNSLWDKEDEWSTKIKWEDKQDNFFYCNAFITTFWLFFFLLFTGHCIWQP